MKIKYEEPIVSHKELTARQKDDPDDDEDEVIINFFTSINLVTSAIEEVDLD